MKQRQKRHIFNIDNNKRKENQKKKIRKYEINTIPSYFLILLRRKAKNQKKTRKQAIKATTKERKI